jgi:hypothetical protein
VADAGNRWLVLIHQIPPNPSYLRVKVGRRLQGLGAVPVKNSVYVLPRSDEALEDFQWVRREIVAGGGDASVCEARFVEGLSDDSVEGLFNAARTTDFEDIAREARGLVAAASRAGRKRKGRETVEAPLLRLRKRLAAVSEIDFFHAPGRAVVEEILASLEATLKPAGEKEESQGRVLPTGSGRTWVTRTGVRIDRIASAWLIRRFIDPEARFEFVLGETHPPSEGQIRFDMFEGEFTHEGDRCTFEVLVRRFSLAERALGPIGEIVHDIDLKDGKFQRPEAAGVDHLIAGIAMRHPSDEARIQEGSAVFEALYEFFRRGA